MWRQRSGLQCQPPALGGPGWWRQPARPLGMGPASVSRSRDNAGSMAGGALIALLQMTTPSLLAISQAPVLLAVRPLAPAPGIEHTDQGTWCSRQLQLRWLHNILTYLGVQRGHLDGNPLL